MSPTELPEVARLALELMTVESTSGREEQVMSTVARLLEERGWVVTRIPVSGGRDDVLATTGAPPRVTFSTHLDTVPPYIAPRIDGDRLAGRGACDAKGIAASMIVAAERLRARGEAVGLLLVVGEETCHDGAAAANARAAANLPPTPRALINGEPTESRLALGTKGAVRVVVRTQGRAAHSAYPELGHSATRDLVRLLAALDDVPLPHDDVLGETTINIGKLDGGVADNVVAPSAEARLMARLVTSQEPVIEALARWADGRATIEPGVMVPPMKLATIPGFETSVVAFATDVPELGNWGTPYLFGPGSIHVAHTDDEWVSVAELEGAVEAYERLAAGALAEL